jgi:hypothetical protein
MDVTCQAHACVAFFVFVGNDLNPVCVALVLIGLVKYGDRHRNYVRGIIQQERLPNFSNHSLKHDSNGFEQ